MRDKSRSPNGVKLIYFRTCPKAAEAKVALKDAGIAAYLEVVQDDLELDDLHMLFSSPTILVDDRIVFGGRQDGSGACSTGMIRIEQILKELKGE